MQDEDGVIIDNFAIWNVFVENIKRVCYNSSKERDKYRYILMLDEDKDNLELFYPSDDIVNIYKGELMRLNSDADFVWDITPEEDAKKLFNTRLRLAEKKAMTQGLAQGIEQGIEQNRIEMIKNFYKIGTPIEDIAKASNLSVDEVKKIIDYK